MSDRKVADLKRDLGGMDVDPWIGVDLDGTLAYYDGWVAQFHIGDPIPEMMERVWGWIEDGVKVKIFTARAGDAAQVAHVKAWLREQGLPDLEVTNVKDRHCLEFWDDRAVRVKKNQGVPCC